MVSISDIYFLSTEQATFHQPHCCHWTVYLVPGLSKDVPDSKWTGCTWFQVCQKTYLIPSEPGEEPSAHAPPLLGWLEADRVLFYKHLLVYNDNEWWLSYASRVALQWRAFLSLCQIGPIAFVFNLQLSWRHNKGIIFRAIFCLRQEFWGCFLSTFSPPPLPLGHLGPLALGPRYLLPISPISSGTRGIFWPSLVCEMKTQMRKYPNIVTPCWW